ncbi:ChbG/HpnK family deacetylase [Aerococcus sp. UMB10185]|uniref:ChbG/HpnK family deacetylase n=1 Tax=unclassified Aerococcus TaxID=2618060 RepID=UPI0008A361DD|nr:MULTISPECIES: ChbG/HpnK family deacetylase [unclassified Aerococcus]KAB0647326.1 ChbG/HpnK family deacetylase [Aerococcus sanguinicola]MDK6233211.1 ChbG/HpnK family deacetylase [Aerococcus sp. UMB10185]MDK6856048.1 ChbG/HpnK family deacetylase [Aerococcus sp. UMB7533]MDK8502351.1 ChbG/HpnK family deacetylase [Aerococcus sp. UMB1112A]OFN00274.1 hypothetical protein HMPREF2626_09330 [Aerococcus sp. HMSC062A02]
MNPIIKKLGYSADERLVVVHADDVGITQASIDAYEDLMALGTISSGSAMVPCSWFPEVVQRASQHPEWDLGLHLAFNAEYSGYKWRPLSTSDPASGFVDELGYFVQDKHKVQETAEPAAIAVEIEAQVQLAQAMGLSISHVDTHTGTLWNKKYIQPYHDVYDEHGILPVICRHREDNPILEEMIGPDNYPEEELKTWQAEGFPLMDGISGMPVEHTYDPDDRFKLAQKILKAIEPGQLTHFAFHPMRDTPEARALNRYEGGRIGDYLVFSRPEMKQFMADEGIRLISYREILGAVKGESSDDNSK